MDFPFLEPQEHTFDPIIFVDPLVFIPSPQESTEITQFPAESFPQSDCVKVHQQSLNRVAPPDDEASAKRARNTLAARKSREKKAYAMKSLERENRNLKIKNEELYKRLNAYLGYTMCESNQISKDERLSGLDIDLGCLNPGQPLTMEVVNAILCLLGSVAPFNIVAVDSSVKDITTSFVPEWLQAHGQGNHQTLLVPLQILSSGTASGPWLLTVCDSHSTRILDSLPTSDHIQSAKEKIDNFRRQLACWPATELIRETNCALQETSVDSGVAVLVNAIYTVTTALGSEQALPQAINIVLWRQALLLLLKVAMGQSYDMRWADELMGNTVLLEEDTPNEMQTLWYPGPDSTDYNIAIQQIESQLQFLTQQRQRLQKAMEQKKEIKAAASGIYSILSSLLQSATLQEEQVKMLTMERMNCIKSLDLLAGLDKLSRVSSFRKIQTTDTQQQDLKKRLREVTTCLAYRERMITALNEGHKAWGEVFQLQEDSKRMDI